VDSALVTFSSSSDKVCSAVVRVSSAVVTDSASEASSSAAACSAADRVDFAVVTPCSDDAASSLPTFFAVGVSPSAAALSCASADDSAACTCSKASSLEVGSTLASN
jgi:hypothetical protein